MWYDIRSTKYAAFVYYICNYVYYKLYVYTELKLGVLFTVYVIYCFFFF